MSKKGKKKSGNKKTTTTEKVVLVTAVLELNKIILEIVKEITK